MAVIGTIRDTTDVPVGRRDEMFSLMGEYYDNMCRAEFDADLDEKQWVIEIEDSLTGALCGFSTQMVFEVAANGRPVRVLFSGDTIIDRRHRQRNPLAGLWGQLALQIMSQSRQHELYWFLICKGYKTYRFLPLFFSSYYPRFDRPLPERERQLLDEIGRYKFPAAYDPRAQIVRANPDGCRLRAGVADVTPERMRNPHVRFFCDRNPCHTAGDEMCCLAPLTEDNFTAAAWMMIRAAGETQTPLLASGADSTT